MHVSSLDAIQGTTTPSNGPENMERCSAGVIDGKSRQTIDRPPPLYAHNLRLQCFTRSTWPPQRKRVLINVLRAQYRLPDDKKYCERAIDAVLFAPSVGRNRVHAVWMIKSDARGPLVQPLGQSLRVTFQLGENIWQLGRELQPKPGPRDRARPDASPEKLEISVAPATLSSSVDGDRPPISSAPACSATDMIIANHGRVKLDECME
ncbi:hypothetical protein N7504_000620 [Penicillium tannophilum]|nr:hypothetical protein N7504_000620 [Penicillium tannophilum]